MKSFQGKVAIITGGTSGIGRTTALAFAEEGAKVVVMGRREKEGAETTRLVKDAGGEGFFIKADIISKWDRIREGGETKWQTIFSAFIMSQQ
ncbi:MAG: hypothetical protein C4291_10575 [Candidatus Dadabacteria bacterium]